MSPVPHFNSPLVVCVLDPLGNVKRIWIQTSRAAFFRLQESDPIGAYLGAGCATTHPYRIDRATEIYGDERL